MQFRKTQASNFQHTMPIKSSPVIQHYPNDMNKNLTPTKLRISSNNNIQNSQNINYTKYDDTKKVQNGQMIKMIKRQQKNQVNSLLNNKQNKQYNQLEQSNEKAKQNGIKNKQCHPIRHGNQSNKIIYSPPLNSYVVHSQRLSQGYKQYKPYKPSTPKPIIFKQSTQHNNRIEEFDQFKQKNIEKFKINLEIKNNELDNSTSFKSNKSARTEKTPPKIGSMKSLNAHKRSISDINKDNKIFQNGFSSYFKKKEKLLQNSSDTTIQSHPQIHLELKCASNDGKKAKYRLLKKDRNGQQLDPYMVYCAKCAKILVQQGFTVEHLQENKLNSPRMINSQQNLTLKIRKSINEKIEQINNQKQALMKHFQKQLDDIDCYYNSVLSLIQQQRVKDRDTILKIRDQMKSVPAKYENQLIDVLKKIDTKIKNNNKNEFIQQDSNLNQLLKECNILFTKKIQPLKIGKIVEQNIQECFDKFAVLMEKQIRLSLCGQNPLPKQQTILFSFQQAILSDIAKKPTNSRYSLLKDNLQPFEQILQQQIDDQIDSERSTKLQQSKKRSAFRNLFPQDQIQARQLRDSDHSPTFKAF